MNTHRKNIRIITAMLFIAYAAIALFFLTGCSILKKNKSKTKTEEKTEETVSELETTGANEVTITEWITDNLVISIEPINPELPSTITTPSGKKTTFKNTKTTVAKETTATATATQKETQAKKETQQSQQHERTTTAATKQKNKASVPWFALLALGFTMFIIFIILLFIHNKTSRL